MQKKLKLMTATYPEIEIPQWQGRRLRGFFASSAAAGSLLHNHGEGGEGVYRYPLVQYKVIRKTPTILAVEEGIREVYPLIMERETLTIGTQSYPCGHVSLNLSEAVVGDAAVIHHYRFLSPWFALNQENYRQYAAADTEQRHSLLTRILTGNILSMAKGLGLTVEGQLAVQLNLTETPVRFKQERVIGFTGTFSANYQIPPLFGLGKGVSRGFGVVGIDRRETGTS